MQAGGIRLTSAHPHAHPAAVPPRPDRRPPRPGHRHLRRYLRRHHRGHPGGPRRPHSRTHRADQVPRWPDHRRPRRHGHRQQEGHRRDLPRILHGHRFALRGREEVGPPDPRSLLLEAPQRKYRRRGYDVDLRATRGLRHLRPDAQGRRRQGDGRLWRTSRPQEGRGQGRHAHREDRHGERTRVFR